MNPSTPGLPVHHQLPEFTQTHVHRVSDAIQPSHPLSSPSPLSFNLYQHQGLCNPRDSQESSPTPQFKTFNSSVLRFLYSPALTSIRDSRKTIALTRRTFVGKVMSLLFNMQSRLVITFLPKSKCLLNSWLQSPFAVILEPPKINSATLSTVLPLFAMK